MLRAQAFMLTAVLTSYSACASDHDQEPAGSQVPGAQIRSAEELSVYLRTTPNSPLDHLPADAKQRFVDSLVFTDGGLGSFQYTELEPLSATEIYQILSLFGAERTTSMVIKNRVLSDSDKALMRLRPSAPSEDHEGYFCAGRATCLEQLKSICMSSC
jgi:hypothetical protein